MKIRYMILGISFLLVGLVFAPMQSHAAGQTSIHFVVPEDEDKETIQEIDKHPLDSSNKNNNRQQASSTGNPKASRQGFLPSTNDRKFYGLSLTGLVICLFVVTWKYKNYLKN